MGVATQILEHVLGASEGRLAVDHPVLSVEWPQPGSEDLGLSQGGQLAREAELAVLKGRLEAGHELATKQATQHADGEEEARAAGNPVGVIQ
jgi:hypothetical protein